MTKLAKKMNVFASPSNAGLGVEMFMVTNKGVPQIAYVRKLLAEVYISGYASTTDVKIVAGVFTPNVKLTGAEGVRVERKVRFFIPRISFALHDCNTRFGVGLEWFGKRKAWPIPLLRLPLRGKWRAFDKELSRMQKQKARFACFQNSADRDQLER